MGIVCCRGHVATAALLVIVSVQRPRDTRVIAAIFTGGQWMKKEKKNENKIQKFKKKTL